MQTSANFRIQALMLLKIERIQYNEQMVLLGYKEEKAAPVKRGRLVRRTPSVVPLSTDLSSPDPTLRH
jgi:hypothetical protein